MDDTSHGQPEQATFTLKVFAGNEVDAKSFTWAKSLKVSDAAKEAADAFGIQGGSPSLENEDDEVLDGDKPLVAVGVRDGACLELVDIGGGV